MIKKIRKITRGKIKIFLGKLNNFLLQKTGDTDIIKLKI